MREKKDYTLEYRIVLPEGTIKSIGVTAHPRFSASGELVEVVSHTHRRDGTQARRGSPAGKRIQAPSNLETVPGLIWSTDPDGDPTHVNQRMLDYSGMRFEDLSIVVGRHSCTPTTFQKLQRLSITQFRPELRTRLCTVCVGRTAIIVGITLVVSLCAINRDALSSGTACLSTSMKRKKAEDQLRRSEADLAEAQRPSHSGVSAYNETQFSMGRRRLSHLGV